MCFGKTRIGLWSLWLLAACSGVFAQHAGHGGHGPGDSTGIAALTQTDPVNDAVLAGAPDQLMLHFPTRVRLVKLVLRDQNQDWVDIDFRYNPRPGEHFTWKLPTLEQATYYTADWAILAANEQLVRGSFSFAFGPGAEPPSVIREAQAILLEQRQGDPDTRYVAPPPTQIIIDRDPPEFDPPFTIQLDDDRDR